jgi:hypothetical protein
VGDLFFEDSEKVKKRHGPRDVESLAQKFTGISFVPEDFGSAYIECCPESIAGDWDGYRSATRNGGEIAEGGIDVEESEMGTLWQGEVGEVVAGTCLVWG